MKKVSQAYILGIEEGRNLLRRYPQITREEVEREIAALTWLAKNHSGDMKETFKGQRDFWKNQLGKKG